MEVVLYCRARHCATKELFYSGLDIPNAEVGVGLTKNPEDGGTDRAVRAAAVGCCPALCDARWFGLLPVSTRETLEQGRDVRV